MLTAALAACHSYDDHDPMQIDRPVIDRTVIIYMAAENDLSVHGWNNLNDIREGSKKLSANQCLLVYVDRSHETELPWLGRFQGGQLTDSVSISDMGISQHDEYASDSRVFEDVLRYAVNHFHASQDYGLVLWGHSTGWLLEDSIPRTRGYGFDNGHNDRTTPTGYYLNIPTMNQILKRIPAHWSYIFADCCLFACLESAYEMRNTVDYIVGSVAEIPLLIQRSFLICSYQLRWHARPLPTNTTPIAARLSHSPSSRTVRWISSPLPHVQPYR